MVSNGITLNTNLLPNDDAVRAALNTVPMKPGLYSTPHCVDMKEMQSEDMQRK